MSDIDTLARTMWAEARGEGEAGMVAVGCAIRNRVTIDLGNDGKPDWWGEGYEGVCKKPWQFSCWNANDPNLPKLLAVDVTDPIFAKARALAERIIRGDFPDPTGGATHYLTRAAFDKSPPGHWCRCKLPCAIIGQHMFFKGV